MAGLWGIQARLGLLHLGCNREVAALSGGCLLRFHSNCVHAILLKLK